MTINKTYPLNQSRLFKIHSKHKLSEILSTDQKHLVDLSKRSDNYRQFVIEKNGKARGVEVPKPDLDKIHSKIFSYLRKVETPDYLHSGIKSRSHVSNALAHLNCKLLLKLDIKKFYQSTKREAIYRFFVNDLKCAPDVSNILSSLCSVNGHVPTGSKLSQLIAYYSAKPMFDEIYKIAKDGGTIFTVYVDDLSFSGDQIPGELIWEAKKVITRYGYKYHKEIRYAEESTKVVTGIALKDSKALVRNKHHKNIYELYVKHLKGDISVSELKKLLGMLNSASQVSDKHLNIAKTLRISQRAKKSSIG